MEAACRARLGARLVLHFYQLTSLTTGRVDSCQLGCGLSQGEQDGFWRILKQSCSILLQTLLHPMSVHFESTAIDNFMNSIKSVGIADEHLFAGRLRTSVLVMNANGGQNSPDDGLENSVESDSETSPHSIHPTHSTPPSILPHSNLLRTPSLPPYFTLNPSTFYIFPSLHTLFCQTVARSEGV